MRLAIKTAAERCAGSRRRYLFWLAAFGETTEARLVECAVSRAGTLGPEYFLLHQETLRFKLGVLAARLLKEGIDPSAVDPYFGRLRSRSAAAQSRIFASLR